MKIFYCILAYNEPLLLRRTINKLDSKNCFFIIHIQKNVDSSQFIINKPNVYYIEDKERIETIWGDVSTTKAALLLFKKALDLSDGDDGYCVLMSGSDYPVKSNDYIYNYFVKKYPIDFFDYTLVNDVHDEYKRIIIRNCSNYWISFKNSHFKIEIKPRRYILLRAVKFKGEWKRILMNIPMLLLNAYKIIYVFLFGKKDYNILKDIYKLNFVASNTWLQLSLPSVKALIDYDKSYLLKEGEHIHNPEEFLIQNILYNLINKDSIKASLVCPNYKDLTNNDTEFIINKINNPNFLFCRKFSSSKCEEILSFIDKKTKD